MFIGSYACFKGIDAYLSFYCAFKLLLDWVLDCLYHWNLFRKMVSSERRAKSKARSRRVAARAHIANVNARRAQSAAQPQSSSPPLSQPHSSQPNDENRMANQLVKPIDRIPDEEFNPLPHGQMVRSGIIRSAGIDPQWPVKLIRFYECWWMVSFH